MIDLPFTMDITMDIGLGCLRHLAFSIIPVFFCASGISHFQSFLFFLCLRHLAFSIIPIFSVPPAFRFFNHSCIFLCLRLFKDFKPLK